MRAARVSAVVAVCLLAAGCGPGSVVARTAAGTSAPSGTAPASRVPAPASSASRGSSAAERCSKPAILPAGASVPAWRLGAIRFVTPDEGFALTAPQVACNVPLGDGRGIQVDLQVQPVRLATTRDGGQRWVATGTELPAAPQATSREQIAAVDGARTWIVTDTGELLATGNGGTTWSAQLLPRPVVTADSVGGWLWALSCPPTAGNACHPAVERMRLPTGKWTATRLGSSTSLLQPQLDVLSATAAVVVLQGTQPALASTVDGGAHWTVRAAPDGPRRMCGGDGDSRLVTAAGLRDWWLLCTGAAAAGSTTQAVMHSADAGRTWAVASAVTSLLAPVRPGSLTRQGAVGIAAGSRDVVWLAAPNSVTESTDGGRTWRLAVANPQGTFGQFDVLSGTDAWLLAPSAGLWHTSNGITWHSVGETQT